MATESYRDRNTIVFLNAGDNFATLNAATNGEITFSSDHTTGFVQLKGIREPSAAQDAATKNYVDTALGSGAQGANTQIQFNNNGAFGANASLTYAFDSTPVLSVAGDGVSTTLVNNFGTGSKVVSVTQNIGAGTGNNTPVVINLADGTGTTTIDAQGSGLFSVGSSAGATTVNSTSADLTLQAATSGNVVVDTATNDWTFNGTNLSSAGAATVYGAGLVELVSGSANTNVKTTADGSSVNVSTATSTAGGAGVIDLTTGAGAGAAIGGAGGLIDINSGAGGSNSGGTGGAGGSLDIDLGNGGTGSTVGGAGGSVTIDAGNGGAGGSGAAGAAGTISLVAGDGADGNSNTAGGKITITGGAGGTNQDGGDIILDGGAGNGTGSNGLVYFPATIAEINAAANSNVVANKAYVDDVAAAAAEGPTGAVQFANSSGDFAGSASLVYTTSATAPKLDIGSEGTVTSATLEMGQGTSTSVIDSVGSGQFSIQATGNAAPILIDSGDADGGATAGGSLSLKSGDGATSGAGGVIDLTAGTGGTTSGALGGAIDINGGQGGSTDGVGGAVNIDGGAGIGAGAGGNVLITGGSAPGAGDGGDVTITAGTSSSGTAGQIDLVTTGGTATFIAGDFTTPTLSTNDIDASTPAGTVELYSNITAGGVLNIGGAADTINLGDATASVLVLKTPTSDTEVANKAYVDSLLEGLTWKDAVRACSTSNLTYASNQITSAPQSLDGVTLAANDRILVKSQTNPVENGIYVVTTLGTSNDGVWDRADDMPAGNTVASVDGAAMFVQAGSTCADTAWVQTNDQGTIGTDGTNPEGDLVFSQFSSSGGAAVGNPNTVQLNAQTGSGFQSDSAFLYLASTDTLQINSDTASMQFGAGQDLTIAHDGSNTTITETAGNINFVVATDITSDSAIRINADSQPLSVGASQDLTIQHNGTNSLIDNNNTGDLVIRNLSDTNNVLITTLNSATTAGEFDVTTGSGTAASGGTGGLIDFTTGSGGTSTATGTDGGAAGAVSIDTGAGGAYAGAGTTAADDGGAGGSMTVVLGTGGATDSNNAASFGGIGGSYSLTAGTGGAASATNGTGGDGGDITLTAGNGGTGNTAAGAGGDIIMAAGTGATAGKVNITVGILDIDDTTDGTAGGASGTGAIITGGGASFGKKVYAQSFHSTSDVRMKSNIQPIHDPLSTIRKIEGYSYNWKENDDGIRHYGVLAQQMESVGLGDFVSGDEAEQKAVDYTALIPFLIGAVKELSNKVESLEAEKMASKSKGFRFS